jgi:hypothetical protein
MAFEMDDKMLADIAALDPVYVDGVGGVTNLGANFGTLFFRYVPVKTENGGLLYERTPVLYVMRPRSSLICGNSRCRFVEALSGPPPELLRFNASKVVMN